MVVKKEVMIFKEANVGEELRAVEEVAATAIVAKVNELHLEVVVT